MWLLNMSATRHGTKIGTGSRACMGSHPQRAHDSAAHVTRQCCAATFAFRGQHMRHEVKAESARIPIIHLSTLSRGPVYNNCKSVCLPPAIRHAPGHPPDQLLGKNENLIL